MRNHRISLLVLALVLTLAIMLSVVPSTTFAHASRQEAPVNSVTPMPAGSTTRIISQGTHSCDKQHPKQICRFVVTQTISPRLPVSVGHSTTSRSITPATTCGPYIEVDQTKYTEEDVFGIALWYFGETVTFQFNCSAAEVTEDQPFSGVYAPFWAVNLTGHWADPGLNQWSSCICYWAWANGTGYWAADGVSTFGTWEFGQYQGEGQSWAGIDPNGVTNTSSTWS